MRTIVVMHAMAGKTTLERAGVLFDVDNCRTKIVDDLLKQYRQTRDWASHDLVWRSAIQKWARGLPDDATIAVHSPGHAEFAASGKPIRVVRYHPTTVEFIRRLAELAPKDPSRCEIAMMNRTSLLNNPTYMALPEWVPPRAKEKRNG